MKSICYISLISLISFACHGLELVIKAEEKKEEPKEEPKGPDLPKPAQLSINAINTTDADFVVTTSAKTKGEDHGYIFIQGVVPKGATSTLAVFSAVPDSSFEFLADQVIMLKSPANIAIKCTVHNKDDEKSENNDETSEPAKEAKKSIDFWLYVPKNQTVPVCTIMFDSL